MGDDVTALLVAIARENAELRQQLASAQDMLVRSRSLPPGSRRPFASDVL